jgi:hypothetical protein
MIAYGDQTIHRFWQENYNDVVSNFDQVSNDGGLTWSSPIEMAGVTDHVTPVALVQRNGDLHFLRTVEKESAVFLKETNLVIEDWEWDGSGWNSTFTQVINIQGDKLSYSMTGGLTGSGELSALVQLEYTNLENESKYEVRAVNRAAANTFSGLSQVAVVGAAAIQTPPEGTPQPVNEPAPTHSFVFTEEPSAFSDTSLRNGIGLALVAVVILLGVVFFRRKR